MQDNKFGYEWKCGALALVAVLFLVTAMHGLHPSAASAQEGSLAEQGADELARKSSNPLGGDFWIVLNQIDNYFMEGKATNKIRDINTWALQPVVPFSLANLIGENWIMVNRPTLPFVMNADVPDPSGLDVSLPPGGGPPQIPPNLPAGGLPFKSKSGFGDMIHFSMVGQSIPQQRWGGGDLVWGVGPTFQFPTASSDSLGSGKYSIGPAFVLSFIGKQFILGGLYQHWASYGSGGKGSGQDVNFGWLNLFYFWNLENGWQIGGTPVITADWEADSDQRWTVPLGLGVYKTHFFGGKLPMKVGVEMQWMPEQPDAYGQEFNIRIVLAPIIPALL
jgi:hypothetical protein